MTSKPNTAKRDARAFSRWHEVAEVYWPTSLRRLGRRAVLALKSLDQPEPGEVLIGEAAKDLRNFMNAYGAWRAKHEEG